MDDNKSEIYLELVKIFAQLEKKMKVRTDGKSKYEIYGKKKVTAFKKEFDGMYFASVVIQKGSVTLYFFPIYTHVQEFKDLPEKLKKCLKGKSCFHIKKTDKEIFGLLKKMIKKGVEIYKKAGWL
jgi:hypothetical protein